MDLAVLRWRDVLPVEEAVETEKGLLLKGASLKRADIVLLNGKSIPFEKNADGSLSIKPKEEIRSLTVLAASRVGFSSKEASLSLSLEVPLSVLEGQERAVQRFILALFSGATRDAYDRYAGGDLPSLVGASSAQVERAVRKASTELMNMQSFFLPPEERLISADVVELVEEPSLGMLSIKVRLVTADGRDFQGVVSVGRSQ